MSEEITPEQVYTLLIFKTIVNDARAIKNTSDSIATKFALYHGITGDDCDSNSIDTVRDEAIKFIIEKIKGHDMTVKDAIISMSLIINDLSKYIEREFIDAYNTVEEIVSGDDHESTE